MNPRGPDTVAAALLASCRQFETNPALITADGAVITYDTLAKRVGTAVAVLCRMGLAPGDRIAIWLPNRPEWVVLQCAAALLGLLIVPVNARYRASEAARVLSLSRASVLFTQPAFLTNDYLDRLRELAGGDLGSGPQARIASLPHLRQIVLIDGPGAEGTVRYDDLVAAGGPAPDLEALAAARSPDDRLWIFWTSGSTSAPKGAVLVQSAVRNVWNWTSMAGYRADDRVLVTRPYFYIAGNFWCLLGPLLHGAAAVIGQYFTPEEMVRLSARERVTILSGNPLLLKGLVNDPACDPAAFRNVRFGYFGGSSVSFDDLRRIKERIGFQYLLQPYGMTELEGFATSTHPSDPLDVVYSTCGRPLPGIEMRLVDPASGQPVPQGVVGELLTRGRGLVDYEGVSEQDRARLFDRDGWFRTGDLLRLRADGRYEFVGRSKDLIKVGGENTTATEIETTLMEHPDIAGVAVIGVPDEARGEVPVAYLEWRAGREGDPESIRQWCRQRMAPFKVPARFEVVGPGAWPMTASGKIAKHLLPA
ncbi:MAG: class I adenylate-forming enzyme family protein [Lautropia sp.]